MPDGRHYVRIMDRHSLVCCRKDGVIPRRSRRSDNVVCSSAVRMRSVQLPGKEVRTRPLRSTCMLFETKETGDEVRIASGDRIFSRKWMPEASNSMSSSPHSPTRSILLVTIYINKSSYKMSEQNESHDKPCTLCNTPRSVLVRCQIDETGIWHFVCPGRCWTSVSGGEEDARGYENQFPHYRYGGMWKNKHVDGGKLSAKKPKKVKKKQKERRAEREKNRAEGNEDDASVTNDDSQDEEEGSVEAAT